MADERNYYYEYFGECGGAGEESHDYHETMGDPDEIDVISRLLQSGEVMIILIIIIC